jgi:glycosyltransferase involved in cell wall biosynthesis
VQACTIIARNYTAQARVLAASFAAHNPGSSFSTLVIDGPGPHPPEPYELVLPADLDLHPVEFRRMAAIYDVMELATAVKPWLLRYLLERGEPVVYLDPDIELFGPITEAAELADQHGIVLTPHIAELVPHEARELVHQTVLYSGIYNLGFIAVSDSALPFLRWWEQRLARECRIAPAEGRFVDQRWADFVPGVFDHYILRNPAWNVAWWNLGRRSLRENSNGYQVDGEPLAFFHYSGFDPRKPHLLSKFQGDQPPILLSEEPAIARICGEYASKLFAAEFDVFSRQPYAFDTFGPGIRLDLRMRRLYRSALVESEEDGTPEPPNPFDDEGSAFIEWLREPDDTIGGAATISRYLQKVRFDEPALLQRFYDLRWISAEEYLEWVRLYGWRVSRIPHELRPPRTERRDEDEPQRLEPGVNVVGYLRAELGIGEAARMLMRGVDSAGIPYSTFAYEKTLSRQKHELDAQSERSLRYDTNLICVNADQLPSFTYDIGPEFFRDRYSIGMWFWELNTFPDHLHGAFEVVQEVWVASDFVRAAVAATTKLPVLTIPLPVETRQDLGEPPPYIRPDQFMFLFSFDFLSVFDRKNPLGVVEAFQRAFEPSEGPALVLKSINGEHALRELEQLRYASRGRSDIVVVDEYVSAREKDALTARCDCYVSLHRSEGFGLTMAEAMAWGKPVIATGYSGNLEFMDGENSYLVPFTLGETRETSRPYPPALEWAEPDLDEAARLMRHVYENPTEARKKGARGQMRIRKDHSPQRTGEFIAEQLERIEADREPRRDDGQTGPIEAGLPGLAEAERFAQAGPQATAAEGPHGRLGEVARRTLFRLLKPYTARHHEFERGILEAISALDDKIVALDERIDRLQNEFTDVEADRFDRIERLERRVRAFEAATDRALSRVAGQPVLEHAPREER